MGLIPWEVDQRREVECIARKSERTGILLEGMHKAVWPEGMK